MGRQGTRDDVIYPPILPPLQIWSMDSDEPVHSLQVNQTGCWFPFSGFACRPNGKTEDVDGGIAAARKLKKNLTIAW